MALVSSPGGLRERALAKLLPQNGLLAVLPEDARERVLPHLALTDLPAGQQLGQADGSFARAYFPLEGVVSLVEAAPAGGERIRALVGREGVVGVPTSMGQAGVTCAVVQAAGYGLALGSEALLEEWGRGGALMRVLLQYKHTVAAQDRVLAACGGRHTLDQRLASLLSLCVARAPGQEVLLAQDATARLLGASGSALAAAVERLRMAGAATWRRPGLFAALDDAALRSLACRCGSRSRRRSEEMSPADDEAQPVISPAVVDAMLSRAASAAHH